jgi:creatinine amidohydrolase/Fe(II)-dependent formamide hydrolase-like protein
MARICLSCASASAASIAAARLVAEDPNPVPVAVLPGLWLGLSEHHLPFGGTISVDYAAYRAVLENVVRSLRALGFARLLIVNGHGGNIDPLAVASRELAVAYDFPIVATTPWFLAPEKIAAIFESDTAPKHACEGETSVMMAIAGGNREGRQVGRSDAAGSRGGPCASGVLAVLFLFRTRADHRHLGGSADRHSRKGQALPCRAG